MPASILLQKIEDAIRLLGDFDTDDPIATYVEFVLAVPSMRPRRIERAREFVCPAEHEAGLEKLEEAIKQGRDLLPWMSKRYRNDRFYAEDHLMHLYSVSHFHLGEQMDSNQRISRTDKLLFALVSDNVVYELNIRGHGGWGTPEFQEILLSNWPEVFGRFILSSDIVDGAGNQSHEQQVLELTRAGVCVLVRTQSGLSMPVGGGVTTARTSHRAMQAADRLRYAVQQVEDYYLHTLHLGDDNLNASRINVERDRICLCLPHYMCCAFPLRHCL